MHRHQIGFCREVTEAPQVASEPPVRTFPTMARELTVSSSIVIDVDPQTAYAHVSDPTRMGESSPENLGAKISGATAAGTNTEAYVGMEFDGRNKRGPAQWTTRCGRSACSTRASAA